MLDSQNNRTPDLPANGASVPQTILQLEQQLMKIWQENSVHKIEMKKEAMLIKEKVMFLGNTITSMTTIILKQAGTIQDLRLANEKLQKSESSSALELECQLSQRLLSSSPPSQSPPSSLRKVEMADMSDQGGILTVILASRMKGNPQISGKISGQNHAPFMSRMGSGQNHALFMSRMGFISSENKLKHKEDVNKGK